MIWHNLFRLLIEDLYEVVALKIAIISFTKTLFITFITARDEINF